MDTMFVISRWRVFCRKHTKDLELYIFNILKKIIKNLRLYCRKCFDPLCLCHKFCCRAYWAPHDLLAHILFNSYLFYHHHFLHSLNTTNMFHTTTIFAFFITIISKLLFLLHLSICWIGALGFQFLEYFWEGWLLIRWAWSRWWYWWLWFPAINACRAVIWKELAGQYEVEGQYWFERQWLFNLRCADWMEWEHSWSTTV